MAAYDILALIPDSPSAGQATARVPGSGNTYSFPRLFGLSSGPGVAPDVLLSRDAANALALRNGTAAQAFNVYNTYTDASNYERGFIRYASNIFDIGHEAAGAGTADRIVRISTRSRFQLWNTQYNYAMLSTDNSGTLQLGTNMSCAGASLIGASSIQGVTGYIEGVETTDPAAPSSDRGRMYYRDNGSGKTQLCVRFSTGAVQVIATEP